MAFTLQQFAKVAERSTAETLSEIGTGRLEAQQTGSLWLIDRDSAARWLARRYSPATLIPHSHKRIAPRDPARSYARGDQKATAMVPSESLNIAAIHDAHITNSRPPFHPSHCAEAPAPERVSLHQFPTDYASDTRAKPLDPTPWGTVARRVFDRAEFRRDNPWAVRVKDPAS